MAAALGTCGLLAVAVDGHVRVPDIPRSQLEVQLLHAGHVRDVVLAHFIPRVRVTLETFRPQLEAGELGVLVLLRLGQVGGHPLQLLAGEAELLLRHQHGVDYLERRRRQVASHYQPGLNLRHVEALAVLADDKIGLVQQVPQLLQQGAVVSRVVSHVVVDDLRFAQPLRTERQDVPLCLDLVEAHVLLEQAPHVAGDW